MIVSVFTLSVFLHWTHERNNTIETKADWNTTTTLRPLLDLFIYVNINDASTLEFKCLLVYAFFVLAFSPISKSQMFCFIFLYSIKAQAVFNTSLLLVKIQKALIECFQQTVNLDLWRQTAQKCLLGRSKETKNAIDWDARDFNSKCKCLGPYLPVSAWKKQSKIV